MNLIEEIAQEIENNRLIPFAEAGVSSSHVHVNWNDICSKMNDITGYSGNDNLEAAQIIISPKNGQEIPKITNLQYNKSKANYGTKKKSVPSVSI